MASKRRGAKYHTFSESEKATILTYLGDCWLAMQRERAGIEDKAKASGFDWAMGKRAQMRHVEAYLRQRFSYLNAVPPGEEPSADTDQSSSGRAPRARRD